MQRIMLTCSYNSVKLWDGERELVRLVHGGVWVSWSANLKANVCGDPCCFVGAHVKLHLCHKRTICRVWALMELLVL